MEYLVLIVLVAGFALVYFKKESVTEDNSEEDKNRILELKKSLEIFWKVLFSLKMLKS